MKSYLCLLLFKKICVLLILRLSSLKVSRTMIESETHVKEATNFSFSTAENNLHIICIFDYIMISVLCIINTRF